MMKKEQKKQEKIDQLLHLAKEFYDATSKKKTLSEFSTHNKLLIFFTEDKERKELTTEIINQLTKNCSLKHLARKDIRFILIGVIEKKIAGTDDGLNEWKIYCEGEDAKKILEECTLENLGQSLCGLDECFAAITTNFSLRIPYQWKFPKEIYGRFTVKGSGSDLYFTSIYKGSRDLASQKILGDCRLIFAILDFSRTIQHFSSFTNYNFQNENWVSPDLTAKSEVSISPNHLTLAMTQKALELLAKNYAVRSTKKIDDHLLDLLVMKNDKLQTALTFLNSEISVVVPASNFLKYWTAIEVLLQPRRGHNEDDLLQGFSLICPEDQDKFVSYYSLRCDLVHTGKASVTWIHLREIEELARKVFNKFLYLEFSSQSHPLKKRTSDKI